MPALSDDYFCKQTETSAFKHKPVIDLISSLIQSSLSGSFKGNLLKFTEAENGVTNWYKLGRLNSREHPHLFTIEPVIEVLTYKYASALGIPCVKQELVVIEAIIAGCRVKTLTCKSKDF
jgi:hypothetical protein